MTDLLLVWGTRPEAIKLGPVAAELTALGADWRGCCTGQHTSLLAGSPAETDLVGSESLGLASDGVIPRWMTRIQERLAAALQRHTPKCVVVQGDTMSAHAGALAAAAADVPLAHVEAGVRSHNLDDPWPEETTRVSISQLAQWHYAPTSTAFTNLVTEGVQPRAIRVTGNSVVSALARYVPGVVADATGKHLLVTLHRREMQNKRALPPLLEGIRRACTRFPQVRFVWPLHPAVAKVLPVADLLQGIPNLTLSEPLGYYAFVQLLANAKGLLTDSGGAVEEAATLGVPCVILRRANDRPEAVEAGVAQCCRPDAAGVLMGTHWLLKGGLPRRATRLYGDPDAAALIAQHLIHLVED